MPDRPMGAMILIAASTALLLSATEGSPAEAKRKPKFDPFNDLATVIRLPIKVPSLSIDISNADFLLRHEKRNDIEVRVNYPNHWNTDDLGNIKQTDFAKCPTGIYNTQNGNSLMGMGTVDTPIQINISDAVYVNNKKMKTESKRTRESRGIEINTEGIFVDGRKVKPDPNSHALDVLQIAVPEQFTGGLQLTAKGSLLGKIDSWTGADLSVTTSGRYSLSVGKVKTETKSTFAGQEKSRLEIEEVQCSDLSGQCAGSGSLAVKKFSGQNLTVNANDSGKVEVTAGDATQTSGQSKDKATVSLGGASGPLNAGKLNLSAAGESNVEALVVTSSCEAKTAGKGAIALRGNVKELKVPPESGGGVTVQFYTPEEIKSWQ